MIKAHADQRINRLNRSGGFNHCNGIMILDWQDGLASVRVDLNGDHLNPLGLVHGGLYAGMLDVALAMSGSYRPAPDGAVSGADLVFNNAIYCANAVRGWFCPCQGAADRRW